jgi:hypothetical protein
VIVKRGKSILPLNSEIKEVGAQHAVPLQRTVNWIWFLDFQNFLALEGRGIGEGESLE